MTVFGDKHSGPDPFGVGGDHCVGWFETHLFVFNSGVEWNNNVFVRLGHFVYE